MQTTESYPHNLGEGKLAGNRENDIHYWLESIYKAKGEMDSAKKLETSDAGLSLNLLPPFFYNDQLPIKSITRAWRY